ncbi:uncharacterized protein BJ171DRAFT_485707, partial [Polychytrium aggregatum]|uniref:uncharacterized protein n=1 Tax=Polychytrium aggregatum TaxID=110093 RepID=UPI0022FEDEA3
CFAAFSLISPACLSLCPLSAPHISWISMPPLPLPSMRRCCRLPATALTSSPSCAAATASSSSSIMPPSRPCSKSANGPDPC